MYKLNKLDMYRVFVFIWDVHFIALFHLEFRIVFPIDDNIVILQFCRLKFGFGGISASCETTAVREMSLYS